jgi:hypothetical protein
MTTAPAPAAPLSLPEPWLDDIGVRMLIAKEAMALWRGDLEIPEAEKSDLLQLVGRRNWSHFGFVHDLVAESGVELMMFRDRTALCFGYEAKRTTWLPSPAGGIVVQIAARLLSDDVLNGPQLSREVLAGATKAHYQRVEDFVFVADDVPHVLMSAVEDGAENRETGRLEISLARGTYEVSRARLPFHYGAAFGIYHQLRRVTGHRSRFRPQGENA